MQMRERERERTDKENVCSILKIVVSKHLLRIFVVSSNVLFENAQFLNNFFSIFDKK